MNDLEKNSGEEKSCALCIHSGTEYGCYPIVGHCSAGYSKFEPMPEVKDKMTEERDKFEDPIEEGLKGTGIEDEEPEEEEIEKDCDNCDRDYDEDEYDDEKCGSCEDESNWFPRTSTKQMLRNIFSILKKEYGDPEVLGAEIMELKRELRMEKIHIKHVVELAEKLQMDCNACIHKVADPYDGKTHCDEGYNWGQCKKLFKSFEDANLIESNSRIHQTLQNNYDILIVERDELLLLTDTVNKRDDVLRKNLAESVDKLKTLSKEYEQMTTDRDTILKKFDKAIKDGNITVLVRWT